MRIINFLLVVFLVTATFSSCNKENRIERNLWKKGGEWTIESLTVHQVSTIVGDSYTETVSNYGSFTFGEDGSGVFLITVDGDYETGSFNYSNTEDKLTMNLGTNVVIFDMTWKKNEVQISHAVNFQDNGGSVSYTEIFNLKKKK